MEINKLKDGIKKKFVMALKNRFQILYEIQVIREMDNEAGIQKQWNGIEETFMEVREVLVKDKGNRKAWISEDTLIIIQNRSELHNKIINVKFFY